MRKQSLLALAILGTALSAPPARAAGMKIGLSLATQQEERWVRDRETMQAEAKRVGADLRVQIANLDAAKQISQCENLISQGIKVLILAPQDATSAATIIDKAAKAGVKVISYDRLVMDSSADYYYLSFDNVKVGELQGKWLTDHVNKGNFIVLSGSPTDNNAKLLKQGAMKYIQPLVDKGDVKIVFEQAVRDWSAAEAQKLCEQALTASSNNVQGILAANDGTSGGCIQALAAQGLAGKIPITGQDAELAAAIRIVKGEQGMTVFKDTRLLGKRAMAMAFDMLNGKPIDTEGKTVNNNKKDVPSVLLTPFVVDKTNLDKVLIDSGYLKREQVYKK